MELKEYRLCDILKSLITAYHENEKKLRQLGYLSYTSDITIQEFYYYLHINENDSVELLCKYMERKNFIKRAINQVLEALRLDFKSRNAILCTLDSDGNYIIENEKHKIEVWPRAAEEFKETASEVTSSKFAVGMKYVSSYNPNDRIITAIFPSAFSFRIPYEGPKNLGISYKAHNNQLNFTPNGLTDNELDDIFYHQTINSEYFNEYQRQIIESGIDTIGTNTINNALKEAHSRIRNKK